MADKTDILLKARTLTDIGMEQTATPLWLSAASCEERLAPMLEALGHHPEAAMHRVSSASCFRKAGELSRAANLYRAALAGPLTAKAAREVEQMLAECLDRLRRLTMGKTAARVGAGVE